MLEAPKYHYWTVAVEDYDHLFLCTADTTDIRCAIGASNIRQGNCVEMCEAGCDTTIIGKVVKSYYDVKQEDLPCPIEKMHRFVRRVSKAAMKQFEDSIPKYLYCSVLFRHWTGGMCEFHWISPFEDIAVDDEVLVPYLGNLVPGVVTGVSLVSKKNAPYPVSRTLQINAVVKKAPRFLDLPQYTAENTEPFVPDYCYNQSALVIDDRMEIANAVFRGLHAEIQAARQAIGVFVKIKRITDEVSEFVLGEKELVMQVMQEFPNLKVAMFVEFFHISQVYMAYSRSGYSYITDSYYAGDCDFHEEMRWDWKHLPTEKKFRASSLFINSGERAGIYYSFRYHDDWEAMNYVVSVDGMLRQIASSRDAAKAKKEAQITSGESESYISTNKELRQIETARQDKASQAMIDISTSGNETLEGKTFVVTGDLFNYPSREDLKKLIEQYGGKLTGSVSSKTTALITNFPDSGTTKIKKAKELGIEIITEEEFLRCYLSEESEDTSKSIQPELEEDTEPQAVGPRAWETLFLPWILERGRDYADQGKVSDIRKYPGKVCARIMGQDSYDISITYNEIKEIQNIQCTCPYAAGANYCKHSAALLYAIDLDLKPLTETEDWDEFDEESDLDGEETGMDEVEDDFDGDGKEYVSFNLVLGIVPDFDTAFNGVVKMIKSFLSNVHGAKSWSKGIQADRKNGEIIIEEDPLSHDTYEAIFPKMCEEIAKKYPNLPFQGVAEYSELRGDSGEVCLVRYFENKLSVLNITSGCRLAICPECEADVMSLVELAETLINDPESVLVCEDCGAEFTPQELFEDDWGLAPSWVINTYDMAEMPSSETGSAVCTQTDILTGKTFVVTGDLYHYASRDVLKGIIEAKGGKLTGSVSSKTTALITNSPDSGTTKIKKAKELGIEIITEEEFIRRCSLQL